jgi:pimeloyl-ACP methyl ester carboxylesterase
VRTVALYLGNELDDQIIGPELSVLSRDVPTLLVWGSQDRSLPIDYGSAAHAVLRDSRLAIFEDAAHVPNLERPELFNRVVVGCIRNCRVRQTR